ncbi:LemA family protein [Granulosicoccaceae sp. 1_MG-2023]|nr:LemA family protein [Granulosicoccaceae sp. 1_MG-2023]
MSSTVVLLIVLVALALFVVSIYNKLVAGRNDFRNAFSQIDVQLQRRYELIPNLVETAKGYLKHENETLTAVVEARNEAAARAKAAAAHPEDAAMVGKLASAESTLSGAMGRFSMLVENYPELKADQTMQNLFDELVTTDNRISFARQAYSDAVMQYNINREVFPANIVAGIFNFREADLFAIEEPEMRKPVRVSFA